MGRGSFKNHKRMLVTFDTHPGDSDMVWVDQTNGVVYNYDLSRSKWLSTDKDILEFARKGAASGMYIPLLGDLSNIDDVYTVDYNATILGILCRSTDGNKNKAFEVMVNGNSILSFSYNNSLIYSNDELDININKFDKINLYVNNNGKNIRDTVCRINLARRYINE
jgi:hypothetical protein